MIDDALREELSALIDGVLPEKRAKELRRRIREEEDLSREFRELERAVLAVRALPRAAAPVELRGRLKDARIRRPRGRILRLGALVAAAVVLVAAGLAFHLRDGTPPVHFEAVDKGARDRSQVEFLQKKQAPAPPEEAKLADRMEAKDDASGARKLEAREGAAAAAQPAPEKAKGEKRAAPAKNGEGGLLAAVAKTREIPASDRKAYLRQVAALAPDKARAHVRVLVGDEALGRLTSELALEPKDGGRPVLATIRLEDREEAILVTRILGAASPSGSVASVRLGEGAKDQMATDVEGAPGDLLRLGRWLELLDLDRPAAAQPDVTVFGEARRDESKEAEPKVRSAVVRLRFGKPPEPEETPPKGK